MFKGGSPTWLVDSLVFSVYNSPTAWPARAQQTATRSGSAPASQFWPDLSHMFIAAEIHITSVNLFRREKCPRCRLSSGPGGGQWLEGKGPQRPGGGKVVLARAGRGGTAGVGWLGAAGATLGM